MGHIFIERRKEKRRSCNDVVQKVSGDFEGGMKSMRQRSGGIVYRNAGRCDRSKEGCTGELVSIVNGKRQLLCKSRQVPETGDPFR